MNSTVKPENDIAGTATQRPLLSRDFVLLVAGQGISLFGNVMLRFAMSMWVLDETGSATIFASVLAISIVPTILLSPFGGVLADRVNRRTIMVALDAISAVLVLASAIVFATTGFHIVAIATMQVLLAVLGAFETPTVQAALPQMFRQYGPATMRQGMAVINQVQQLSSLLPSFLGGVLYAMFGIRLMMIIAIASFAGAAALECFIRLSAPDRGDEELPTPLEDLKAGVRFLIKDRPNVFRLLLFAAALNFVLIGYSGVGFPYTIRTVLGFDATVYGIADGLIGVSGVAGAFIAGLFAAKLTMRWLPGLMATLTLAMVPQGIVFLLPVDAWTKLVVLIVFTCGTMVASCFTKSHRRARHPAQYARGNGRQSDVHGRGREHVCPAARPDGVRLGLRPNAGRHRAVHHHRPVRRAHRADGSARQAVRGLTIGAHATSCRPAIIESPHEKARKGTKEVPMATLNPQSLVTLWQIEQYGSFSATAKATGWSQPAISQQIKKLEAQCGSTLVQRTSHGVELTATGSMLARHGEAIADRLERAAREVEDYRHHRFDHLHLVAPPSICSTIAARTVVKLSMFTDIELSLIQMEPPEAIGLISQGKADTAAVFRYSSIPNFLHIGDDLTFHSLGYDPMRLLVRRSSGIAKRFEETGEPVPLSAAKDEHWIAGCPTCRANLVKLATRAGFKPDIRHCTDDYWATQNLVEVGMGVSLVPALDTHINLQGDLVACPIADDFAAREVGIVTRAGDHRPALGSLLEELERTALKYLSAK